MHVVVGPAASHAVLLQVNILFTTLSLLSQRGQGRFYERQKEECVVIHFVKIVLQLSLFVLVDVPVGRWSS